MGCIKIQLQADLNIVADIVRTVDRINPFYLQGQPSYETHTQSVTAVNNTLGQLKISTPCSQQTINNPGV